MDERKAWDLFWSYDRLASFGLGLERSVNFGLFSTLGRWIYRALLVLHRSLGNFGWAIILLTFGVQLIVSPLTVTSFKHSQKMKVNMTGMMYMSCFWDGSTVAAVIFCCPNIAAPMRTGRT